MILANVGQFFVATTKNEYIHPLPLIRFSIILTKLYNVILRRLFEGWGIWENKGKHVLIWERYHDA